MPSFCVVLDCEQKYAHTADVSFHKFPKDEDLINQWKIFTGRCESWVPSRWSAICSRHFKENDFKRLLSRKILKRNAVPSVLLCQNRNSNGTRPSEGQTKNLPEANAVKIINNAEIFETRKSEMDSKVIAFQQHLPATTSENSTINTISEIFSIPLDIPLCIDSQHLEPASATCNMAHQGMNEGQQYDMNVSGASNFLNFYDSSAAPCRLCGQEDHITNSFLNDFEIFGMIQKCMPTLNIRQDDMFSKEVCSNCLEQLENFNAFVDQVIVHQKNLMENVQPIEQTFKGKHPTVISSVKIKQEPISSMKVNIKQEILDSHNPMYPDDNLNTPGDHSASEQNNFQDHDDTLPIEKEIEEQKFHFRDSDSLATREIVKNCDIIEIINLEDGYIDIPDDEIDETQNGIEQRILNEKHPKVIDNTEIKIQKKPIEDTESFAKERVVRSLIFQYLTEEHNYTKNCGIQIDQIPVNDYKQEAPEEQADNKNDQNTQNDETSNKNYDLFGSNFTIHKSEVTNSPKKIIPKKEKYSEKFNISKESENQINNNTFLMEPVQSVNYIKKSIKSNSENSLQGKTQNIENEYSKDNILFDFQDRLICFEEDSSNSNYLRSKISNKSSIVVINESILKPGDMPPFELRKCLECGLQFFSVDSFNEHKRLHNNSGLLLDEIKTSEAICTHFCVLCESNFDSFYELLKHRSKCRVKNSFSSKTPNKILRNIWNCPMCLKVFTSKLALNNHRKYICKFPQNGNCFNCKYCGDTFKKWVLCRKHEKLCRTKRIRRTIDKKKENQLDQEIENVKKSEIEKSYPKLDNANPNEQENSSNRYNCEACNRSYSRYQNLLRHKKVHRPKDEWNYKCGSCNKRFDRMYDLKTHLKSAECPCVPSKPDTIFFVCQICGKKLKTLQVLKEHGVTHSDQLPYVCQICNKSFKALRNLRQHKITHTDTKTVQCNLCDKTFKRLNGLLQHKRGFHLKIKPHICNVCKHAYSLKGDMLRCKHKFLNVS